MPPSERRHSQKHKTSLSRVLAERLGFSGEGAPLEVGSYKERAPSDTNPPRERVPSNKEYPRKGHSQTRGVLHREGSSQKRGTFRRRFPKESSRETHQPGQAEAGGARGTGSRGPRQRRLPRTHRSCSAPRDPQLGPGPASGRELGSGLVASHGDGSLEWRLRQRWQQDDGRPTDRLRGRRGARSGSEGARARAEALTPGGRSCRGALGAAARSHRSFSH